MHPEVYKEAHPSFCPIFQLNVGLTFMDKWAFRFDVTQIMYSNSFNNGIMFDLVFGSPLGFLGMSFFKGIKVVVMLQFLFFSKQAVVSHLATFDSSDVTNSMHYIELYCSYDEACWPAVS